MQIYLGADHAGYEMKEALQAWLKKFADYKVTDIGTFSPDPFDYPIIAREVAEKVFENQSTRGILICGSGEGMCITANKMRGIRAGLADSVERAKAMREHNDANIVCLGSRFTDLETAKKIVETFLTTAFSTAERHKKRVDMIEGNNGFSA